MSYYSLWWGIIFVRDRDVSCPQLLRDQFCERRYTPALRPDRGLEIRRLPIQVAERPGNNTGFMFARSEMHDTTAAAVMPGTGHSTASERSTTRFPRGAPGVYGSVRLKEFYF